MNETIESEPKMDPKTEFENVYYGLFRKYNNFIAIIFMNHGASHFIKEKNLLGSGTEIKKQFDNLREQSKYDEGDRLLYGWLATSETDLQEILKKIEDNDKTTHDYRSAMAQAGIIEEDYAKLVKIERQKPEGYQITDEDVVWLKGVGDKIENAFGILEEMGYDRTYLIT